MAKQFEQDYIDVKVPTTKDKIEKEINMLEGEYHGKKIPYDRHGAKVDFGKYVKEYEGQLEESLSRNGTPPPFKSDWNWREYAEKKRWVAETEWRKTGSEPNMRTGQNTTIFVYTKKYTSISGGTVTMTLSQEEYDDLMGRNKK